MTLPLVVSDEEMEMTVWILREPFEEVEYVMFLGWSGQGWGNGDRMSSNVRMRWEFLISIEHISLLSCSCVLGEYIR
jgi:hypothetical protein